MHTIASQYGNNGMLRDIVSRIGNDKRKASHIDIVLADGRKYAGEVVELGVSSGGALWVDVIGPDAPTFKLPLEWIRRIRTTPRKSCGYCKAGL
jgi:hypothetical protein